MSEVFADTSGWANFFVRTEPFHAQAKNLMQQWHSGNTLIITTNYVLIELVALFTSPLQIPRAKQIKAIETIKTASWVDIVHIDATLHEEAWKLLKERKDKTWSLVDCASFTVMHHRRIFEAFSSDHHFDQAGFVRKLR